MPASLHTRENKEIDRIDRVNIRPGVSVLSVLRHLNYKPWFALAEFVDNSVQSYLSKRDQLEGIHGNDFKLKVRIDIESGHPSRISIKDNAAGISRSDFPRAFRPAEVPPDRSGLSEFGMGMKSAACWFSPKWQVRTKALGESAERLVRFDIERIVNDQIEELEITEAVGDTNAHFTEIILDDLHHVPIKKTLAKIKEHIADIYRVYIREGLLELSLGDELLTYEEPSILRAPYVREPEGEPQIWRKDIHFDFGDGLSVTGFAALRDPGSFAKAGFALFRRKRLIQGSADEGYRPGMIFGQPGSHRSLRLFGELHLEGFEVSHTKDGFRWDENEQPFLELLKEELNGGDLPLLRQADEYRTLATRNERKNAAEKAVNRATDTMERNLPDVLPRVADESPVDTRTEALESQAVLASKEFKIRFRDNDWVIRVELSDDPAEGQWLSISDQASTVSSPEILEIRLSLTHPFMVNFAQTDPEDVEALLRVAAGLALAEKLAREAGQKYTGTIRRNLNDILREALSQP
ncbi:MAG: ATP-binding protein [Rickettsiales bacterium]|nr:ATP-binding protein [Rickettsiales bacterium]